MFRTILLALDRRGLAERAIPAITAFAKPGDGEVIVLAVHDSYFDLEPAEAAVHRVDDVVKRLRAAGLSARGQTRTVYRRSSAEAIAGAAEEFKVDLVALGSHGRGDLAGLLLGSVSHEVAAKLDGPVLVVHGEPYAQPEERPAQLERILVAVDAWKGSEAALDAARQVAEEHGATVRVVHALEFIAAEAVAYVEDETEARKVLDQAVERLGGSGRAVESRLLRAPGPVPDLIAREAEDWQADLIVLGSRRPSDLGGLLLGSVAHGLVRRTRRPVLLAERVRVPAGGRL